MQKFSGGEQPTSVLVKEVAPSDLQLRELAFRKTTMQTKSSVFKK
jgi:hypothetical protein